MTTRWSLRVWVTLSALAMILLFATVAAEAMLLGTRPPSAQSMSRLAAPAVAACPEGQLCSPSVHTRKASRAQQCATQRFSTI